MLVMRLRKRRKVNDVIYYVGGICVCVPPLLQHDISYEVERRVCQERVYHVSCIMYRVKYWTEIETPEKGERE